MEIKIKDLVELIARLCKFEGKIEFDPAAMKVVNNDKANGALRREYREGWSL